MSIAFRLSALLVAFGFFSLEPNTYAHDLAGIKSELDFAGHGNGNSDAQFLTYLDSESVEVASKLRLIQLAGTESKSSVPLSEQFVVSMFGGVEQVYLANLAWAQYKVLKICFFDGSKAEQDFVIERIDEILSYTNLTAAVSKDECNGVDVDIQIRIHSSACVAAYGRDGKRRIAKFPTKETVGLCGAPARRWSTKASGTVLHELMHAIAGAVHENQHPDTSCFSELDLKKVAAELFPQSTAQDAEELIKKNVFPVASSLLDTVLERAEISTLPYEKESIMHYRLPITVFKAGIVPTCDLSAKNNTLSDGDIAMLKRLYPR